MTEGLTRDIVIEGLEGRAAYRERLEFWRNIHYCWLAFLQRQLDSTQTRQAASSNRRSAPRALDASLLEELGDKVVEFSDALEKSGLVDYEMGFFEAELIACKSTRVIQLRSRCLLICTSDYKMHQSSFQ